MKYKFYKNQTPDDDINLVTFHKIVFLLRKLFMSTSSSRV